MAAVPERPRRRRVRHGSLERPVSGRTYRGTWLLVALPLLLAAFSVSRPQPLPRPVLTPDFDAGAAKALALDLSQKYPDRRPGSANALGAAQWFRDQIGQYGLPTATQSFSADVPGEGRLGFQNLAVVVSGRSQKRIVIMAHRDDLGIGPGANDNASGTAALIELARPYTTVASPGTKPVQPAHTLVFLSTDGGSFGAQGARAFLRSSVYADDVVAVINLDAIAGPERARVVLAGDEPRSPAPALVATAAARILEQTGAQVRRPSALRQLVDLAFPFSLYEQAPFVGRGIPALTLTTAGDRPPPAFTDAHVNERRLDQLGRSAQSLLGSLDQGLELARGTSSYLFLGSRIIRGWAIELVLIAALLPFLAAAVDLFARCRRRRIALAPALRSYRRRLGFWLLAGALFELFGLLGAWPGGATAPIAPETRAATQWPATALLALGLLVGIAWLVTRGRLLPRREISTEDELAGHTAALLVLGAVALLVVALNPFALVFLLPSLHAWLWLPQVRLRPLGARAAVLAAGLAGPALLLWSIGSRYGLGFDAPWYLAELVAVGYIQIPVLIVIAGWAAAAGQLTALTAHRYAPYPDVAERPPRPPLRLLVGRTVRAVRERRPASVPPRRALEG